MCRPTVGLDRCGRSFETSPLKASRLETYSNPVLWEMVTLFTVAGRSLVCSREGIPFGCVEEAARAHPSAQGCCFRAFATLTGTMRSADSRYRKLSKLAGEVPPSWATHRDGGLDWSIS
jgi:hypothetical protein